MVQPRIVQHDETRISREIRPHVVVARRVAQLVDRQIVWFPTMAPDEVVRVEHASALRRRIDKTVDRDLFAQRGEDICAVGRDAGPNRRQGREPRYPHDCVMIAAAAAERSRAQLSIAFTVSWPRGRLSPVDCDSMKRGLGNHSQA